MAKMMDSLVLDPFGSTAGVGLNNKISRGPMGSASKPIGPVRPRQNVNYINNNHKRIMNSGDEFIPSNPNTAGSNHNSNNGNGDWNPGNNRNTATLKADDTWKASLRKRDPEIQPSTLPSLTARSR
jgi:hypothetical protein